MSKKKRMKVSDWLELNMEKQFVSDLLATVQRDYDNLLDLVSVELHDELREAFQATAKRIIAQEIASTTGAGMDEIMEALEEIDIQLGE